ncbi:MAG: TonB-dependent receptor [Flavobacterium sp.]|uniref:TonB-dependent receptor n=1 Tax=Flavobacterium sp. TaxID=239 RepID=UPI0022C54A85|nr:TonB-dependent receptor [Flavobacterium sp.]MCZ8197047.1 TonB-dependent receptor [Flavobacterium sp.]
MKFNLLITTLLFVTFSFSQSKGTLTGAITDKEASNAALPFANVAIKGTSIAVTTNETGNYSISLNPGNYVVQFSFIGYENVEKSVTIKTGETATLNCSLGSGNYTLKDVVVKSAGKNREKESALLLEQKKAVEIKQSIGAQEMSRKGVSDAAAAVSKVSGISKQEGSSGIFVRGLGDRYNSTSLNGLPLPSNEPTNKNVALDLFSTDVIQSIGVSKTYYTDTYGDVGGATIDINSKEHSGKGKLTVEFGSSYNGNAFSNEYKIADGIEKHGFYSIKKPTNINKYQFENKWTPNYEEKPVGTNIGISGGKSFSFGGTKKINLFLAASHENSFKNKTGNQLNVGNSNDNIIEDFYDVQKYEFSTKTSGLANIGFNFNKNNTIKVNSIFINSSKSDVNEYYFIDENKSKSFSRQTINEQNKLFVNQLLISNKLSEKFDLNWGGSYGIVNSDMPDRITNTLVEGTNGFIFNTNTPSINSRYFQSLEENEISGKAVLTYKFNTDNESNYKSKLHFGLNTKIKSRDFEATQFNFKINGAINISENDIDAFLNADNQSLKNNVLNTFKILTARNAGNLKPFTYNADLMINAGYVNFENSPNEKLTYTLSVRAEKVTQEMKWDTNISLPNVNYEDAKIDELYILPVITAKYSLNDKQNLRAAASKTYTLPQFIEKAPFRFEVIGESTVGNPFIKPSENYNFDIKWELFPEKDELISITGFGKIINNPISKARLNSALNDNTFINAGENAMVAGAEFEIRKNIWATENKSSLSGGMNLTYMYSEQKLSTQKVATDTKNTISVSFNDSKDGLQGASPLLLNLDLTYKLENETFKPIVSLVGNYFHDRIYSLGNIQSGGNVVEKGIPTLNLISSATIGKNLNISLNVKNLLDSKIERYQKNNDGNFTTYSFKTGLDFSIGVKYSIF